MSRHRFGRPTRPEEHDDPELWRHQFGRRPRRWRAILRDAGLDASTIRLWARNANRGRRFGGYGNCAEEKIQRAVDWLTTPADYLPLPDEPEEAGRSGPMITPDCPGCAESGTAGCDLCCASAEPREP